MTLSASTSRYLAVGLLLLVFIIFFAYVALPYYNALTKMLDQVTVKQQRLSRYEQLLAKASKIEEEMTIVNNMAANNDIFLKGNKPAIASAELRDYVNETVRFTGGILVSSEEIQVQPLPSATPVGLQLEINGEIANLVHLLHSLESSNPLLIFDDFMVTSTKRAPGTARSRRRAQISSMRPGSLDIRFSIVGYMPGENF